MQRVAVFFSLLLITLLSNAQPTTIFEKENEALYRLNYDFKNKYEQNNEILKVLSKAYSKPSDQFSLQYTYKYKTRLILNGKLSFMVSFSGISLSEAIKYKSFDLSELLLPSKSDFSVVWRNNTQSIIKVFPQEKIPLKASVEPNCKFSESDTAGFQGSTLELTEVSLYFDNKVLNAFKERIGLIDDYYNFDSRLKETRLNLGKVNPDSLEMVLVYKKMTEETDKLLDQIKDKKLNEKLSLQLNDPVKFYQSVKDIQKQNNELKDTLQRIIDNLYLAWYNQGKKFYAAGKMVKARQMFEKSISLKNTFVPNHLEIASIDQDEKKWIESFLKLNTINTKLKTTPDERSLLNLLTEKVLIQMVYEAAEFNKSKKFDEAIQRLDSCYKASRPFNGIKLPNAFDSEKKIAFQGKFIQITATGATFLTQKKYREAENSTDSAMNFALKNKGFVADTIEAHNIYSKIVAANIETGTSQITAKKFEEALVTLGNAERICRWHNVDATQVKKLLQKVYLGVYEGLIVKAQNLYKEEKLFSALQVISEAQDFEKAHKLEPDVRLTELLIHVSQKRYDTLIEQGTTETSQNKCQEALNNLETAREIEQNVKNKESERLQRLIYESAHCYILQLIRSAEKEAQRNRINEAQKFHALAQSLIKRYDIKMDSSIDSRFNDLNNAIFSQECQNSQFNYDVQFNAALKFIVQKKFIDADNALNKAIRISDENASCQIVTQNSLDKKTAIKAAVDYQRSMNEIDKLVENENFTDCLIKYEEARKFFEANHLDSLGLRHLTFPDFVKNQQPTNFVNDAIEYFTEKNEWDGALDLMNELYNRGIQPERTKDIQYFLGTKLGIHDKTFKPETKPKDQVKTYIKDEDWYKVFKKAYLAERKK